MRRRLLDRAAMMLLAGAGLATYLPLEAQDIETLARLRGLELPAGYYERVREDPTAFTLPNGLFRISPEGRSASRTEGRADIPVILALFSDSEEPHITQEMIQKSLFDGPTDYGTITEAYLEISRGALTVGGQVYPWVRTSFPIDSVVGTSNGLGNDAKTGAYFAEALDSIESEVDWTLYDSDGADGIPNSGDDDGIVDVVTFEYLEPAASCGGPAIWPHRWRMSGAAGAPYVTDDVGVGGERIKIDGYITQGVSDCTGDNVQTANVISHEFGHVLGLPDYYHPTAEGGALGRRWVLGCWELMAAGSWGCGPVDDRTVPFGPTHLSAHSKQVLGWIDYVELGEVWNHEVFLDPVQSSGLALRVPIGESGSDFLIAEFRTQTGFDHQIPAEGVLLYKQDLTASRRPDPTTNDPYFITVLEQDDNNGLLRNSYEGGNRGEAGDAWGVSNSAAKQRASPGPALLRLNSGAVKAVTVHDVSILDGRARLVISTSWAPILRKFLKTQGLPLTQTESIYLDELGNGNGQYDLGDLRAWLRDNG